MSIVAQTVTDLHAHAKSSIQVDALNMQPTVQVNPTYDLPIFIHSELDDNNLSLEAFRLLGHLKRRAGGDNDAWPSYASMAEHCFRRQWPGAKPETLRQVALKATKELVETGWIVKELILKADGSHGSNHYRLRSLREWREWRANNVDTAIPNEGILYQQNNAYTPGGGSRTVARSRTVPCSRTVPEDVTFKDIPLEDAPLKNQPTNPARNETVVAPTVVGGLVDSLSISTHEFASMIANPDPQTAPALENMPPTNCAEADPPLTLPAQPLPVEEQDRTVALLMGQGIKNKVAVELADQAWCSYDKTISVIDSWRRDCKSQRFDSPAGVLVSRLRDPDNFRATTTDAPKRSRYSTYEGKQLNGAALPPDEDLPSIAPLSPPPAEPSSPVHEPISELSTTWAEVYKEGFSQYDQLKDSRLIKINEAADGTPIYWLKVADPRDVGWVETMALHRIERTLKSRLQHPFHLEVVAA